MDKFLLIIYGPMLAGKTTIANYLCESIPGVFQVSFDKIKRFISDYVPDGRYNETMNGLVYALSDKAAENGLSLIFEGNIRIQKELRQTYKELADKHGLRFVEIKIEAPLEVLKNRFNERIADKGKKLFVRTMEGMLERYDAYMANRDNDNPTFDSSASSLEDISVKIKSILKN